MQVCVGTIAVLNPARYSQALCAGVCVFVVV